MDEKMREVAQVGDVHAFYALIQENPFVLESIDGFPFIDTPLHIAAFEGHIDFAMEMMNLKPSFARKLNPAGFSPMHLALLNHQTLVARELLKVDKDLVRVKGRGGLTPMHFAAKNGNLDLMAEFLEACPECITDVTIQNQTALHIAASNNSFETLELLVCWLQKTTHKYANIWNEQVLNKKNREGSTVLHIAASMNQPQMVRLLLKCTVISKNEVNLNGQSALDMLQGQVNNSKTAHILREAGCMEAERIPARQTLAESLRSKMSWSETFRRTMACQNNKISSDMRNAMLVVAVLILTATYQACLSPPGGVWQGNIDTSSTTEKGNIGFSSSTTNGLPFTDSSNEVSVKNKNPITKSKIGVSVMATPTFAYFYFINTATFMTATCLVFFLLPDETINLLAIPVLLFILCYMLSMIYLAPFSICNFIFPYASALRPLSPILVAIVIFLLVCAPKFLARYLRSRRSLLLSS
ncbi:hypothetical protein SLE2022_109230 [Rubroshorea leprosula]